MGGGMGDYTCVHAELQLTIHVFINEHVHVHVYIL